MPHHKIVNWTTIWEMCRRRYPEHSEREVEATALARHYTEEEVGAFEREGQAAEAELEEVVEATAKEATKVAVRKTHHVAAKDAVEEVAKEAIAAALHEIRHEVAMATLESVAREAAKVAVRELRHGIMVRKAATRMYATYAVAEEARVMDAAAVAAAWKLIDNDKTMVEDSDKDDEDDEVVEDGEERHAGEEALRAAQREAAATHAAADRFGPF
jgi:hypothetical protein